MNSGKSRFIFIITLVIAVLLMLDMLLQYSLEERLGAVRNFKTRNDTASARALFEEILTSNLLLVHSVASFISVHPDISHDEFQSITKAITSRPNYLRNIAAAPGFIITYVYPETTNQTILGADYHKLPGQWKEVELAVKTGDMVVAGPLNLIQGGRGIIGRVPVFYTDKDGNNILWGIVSSVIDFEKMMGQLTEFAANSGLSFRISKKGSGDKDYQTVYSAGEFQPGADTAVMNISVPNGMWRIEGADSTSSVRNPYAFPIHFITLLLGLAIVSALNIKYKHDSLLEISERRFRDFTQSSADWVWEASADGVFTYTSGDTYGMLGYEPEEFIGKTPYDFMSPSEAERVKEEMQHIVKNRLPITDLENTHLAKNGEEVILLVNGIPIIDERGNFVGHRGVGKNITFLKEAEQKLARYIKIVDENVIISQTDLEGNITYVSKAFSEISGYKPEELLGRNHNIIRHPDMTKELFSEMWKTIESGQTWFGEVKNLKKCGGFHWVDTYVSPVLNSKGIKTGYMAVRQDITAKKELEKASVTDKLTGIYNRQKLDSVVQYEHQIYMRYGTLYSIILFDIDHFKRVNDTYGHLIGDYVLKELAMILTNTVRATDVLGRWGGEEFMIVCPQTDAEGAYKLADKIRSTIDAHVFEHVNHITCSFGVADITMAKSYDQMLKLVDDALYEAKNQGRNMVCKAVRAD